MAFPSSDTLTGRRRILVADEDPEIVGLVIRTLRQDGHMVVHAYDGLSAVELAVALDECHLVISNIRVDGMPGIELVQQLRQQLPQLPIVYLANIGRSTPKIEAQLPSNVPILREPFTASMLRRVVAKLLQTQPDPAAPLH